MSQIALDTETVLLDAALDEMRAHGVRRTGISDIARRSGVSRQTLYRYWPDAQALFAAVVTRELVRALPAARSAPATLDELVSLLVRTADRIRVMPLMARLRETDPELLSRYILERLGTSQYVIHAELVRRIDDGQHAGFVREGDVARMAAMVLLIVQSAVQSAGIVREWIDDDAWTTELGRALDGYLRADAR